MSEPKCTCPDGMVISPAEKVMAELSGLTEEFCHNMGDLFEDAFRVAYDRREKGGNTVN